VDNYLPAGGFAPRFDWYAASIKAPPGHLLEAFEGITPGAHWTTLPKAQHGYGSAWSLVDIDGSVGQLWAGGMHAVPHIAITGDAAPAGAALLRECFPDHSVARADVIVLDAVSAGAYDSLQTHCLAVASEMKIRVGTNGDHLLTMQGRTLYLGAPLSKVRLRLYDKEAELRAKLRGNPLKLAAIPPGLVRLELQVRPSKSGKRAAATAEPAELLGYARWTQELLSRIGLQGIVPYRLSGPVRQSDHDRAHWALLRQYGPHFWRLLGETGSPDLVGRNIFNDLNLLRSQQAAPQRANSKDQGVPT